MAHSVKIHNLIPAGARNYLTYKSLEQGNTLLDWEDDRPANLLFLSGDNRRMLEDVARRRYRGTWDRLFLVSPGHPEVWRPDIQPYNWQRVGREGLAADSYEFKLQGRNYDKHTGFQLRQPKGSDKRADPGDWILNGGETWVPMTYVKVQELLRLPLGLLDWVRVQNTPSTPHQITPYLTEKERRTGKDYLTVQETGERCAPNKGFLTCIAFWPLRYIPVQYLRWLVTDGQIGRDPLPLRGRKKKPALATYMQLYGPLPEKIATYLKKYHGRKLVRNGTVRLEIDGVSELPAFSRDHETVAGHWVNIPDPDDPTGSPLRVIHDRFGNQLAPGFLDQLHQQYTIEPDDQWSLENSREFCTWGYWTGRDLPSAVTVRTEVGDDGRLIHTMDYNWVAEFVPSGTAQHVPWQAHGTPLWLDTGRGGSRRWNRLRAGREDDYDPGVCTVGDVAVGKNRKRYVRDYWTSPDDPEAGMVREIDWTQVSEAAKQWYVRATPQDEVAAEVLVALYPGQPRHQGCGPLWLEIQRATRQADWRPNPLPGTEREAWRQAGVLLSKAELLRLRWEEGRRFSRENTRATDEVQREHDRQEDLDLLAGIELDLHEQVCYWLDGSKQGAGMVAAIEQVVVEARNYLHQDEFVYAAPRTEGRDFTISQENRLIRQLCPIILCWQDLMSLSRPPRGLESSWTWFQGERDRQEEEARRRLLQLEEDALPSTQRKKDDAQERVDKAVRTARKVAHLQRTSVRHPAHFPGWDYSVTGQEIYT